MIRIIPDELYVELGVELILGSEVGLESDGLWLAPEGLGLVAGLPEELGVGLGPEGLGVGLGPGLGVGVGSEMMGAEGLGPGVGLALEGLEGAVGSLELGLGLLPDGLGVGLGPGGFGLGLGLEGLEVSLVVVVSLGIASVSTLN